MNYPMAYTYGLPTNMYYYFVIGVITVIIVFTILHPCYVVLFNAHSIVATQRKYFKHRNTWLNFEIRD